MCDDVCIHEKDKCKCAICFTPYDSYMKRINDYLKYIGISSGIRDRDIKIKQISKGTFIISGKYYSFTTDEKYCQLHLSPYKKCSFIKNNIHGVKIQFV